MKHFTLVLAALAVMLWVGNEQAYGGFGPRGSGFNQGDLQMEKYAIDCAEVDADPSTPLANHLKVYCKDDAGTTKLHTKDASGTVTALGGGGAAGGSNTQLQYNNSSAFGGISGATTDGTSIALKNGATSAGYLDFNEDSDNGSNRVRLSGPASTADITLTLPSSDGDASQYLQTDGSGNMSWATVTAGVGGSTGSTDNAMLRADGTGGATVQASVNVVDDLGNIQLGTATSAAKGLTVLDAGTYSTSGTATYGGTNNSWNFTASGLNDSGSGYPPAWVFATSSASAGYNPAGIMKIEGGGVRNFPLYLGSSYKGGVVLGRQGSSTSQIGAGLSFGYGEGSGDDTNRTSIMPMRLETGEIADPTIVNNVVTLGSTNYRFKNYYGVLGNFSGAVTFAGALKLTPAASPPGSPASGDIYVDSTASPDELCFYDGAAWQGISSGTDANCA